MERDESLRGAASAIALACTHRRLVGRGWRGSPCDATPDALRRQASAKTFSASIASCAARLRSACDCLPERESDRSRGSRSADGGGFRRPSLLLLLRGHRNECGRALYGKSAACLRRGGALPRLASLMLRRAVFLATTGCARRRRLRDGTVAAAPLPSWRRFLAGLRAVGRWYPVIQTRGGLGLRLASWLVLRACARRKPGEFSTLTSGSLPWLPDRSCNRSGPRNARLGACAVCPR